MKLTGLQFKELKKRYDGRQLIALRKKYSDEKIWTLWKRWEKPLLKPGTFTRDENGKVEGGEPQPINEKGWRWVEDELTEIAKIETFQDLLTTHLKQIEAVLLPELEKIDKTLDWYMKLNLYQTSWQIAAKETFSQTLNDFRDHGLEGYAELSKEEKDLKREIAIDLRGADCRYAHFDGAKCENAQFDGADCMEAHFDGADCRYAHFDGAVCDGARFDGADCGNANFNGADCEYATFDSAFCAGAHFDGADCEYATFDGTYCFYAHFDGAYCRYARFDSSECLQAHFDGACCYNAYFDGANCYGAHFYGANFKSASFGTKERVLENGDIERKACKLDSATWNKKSSFIGVDTSNVDWSKNPRMKRFIEQQQYVHAAKEGIDEVFGKKKITKPIGWGIKKLISLIDYLSDPLNWFMYAIMAILFFATVHSFCFGAIKFANDVNWFTPIYYSVVTFSTLGFGDIAPLTWYSQLCAVVEVITGYVFLGGLVTFLANWLGRR